jgi:hypothetical protein
MISIVPYRSSWPAEYAVLAAVLRAVLKELAHLHLHPLVTLLVLKLRYR